MATLKEKIVAGITEAMKEKNNVKRDALRVIKGEIERKEQGKDGKVEVSDADIVGLLKKSIENIRTTTNSQEEIAVLEAFLPKQLDKDEVRTIVKDIIANKDVNPTLGDVIKKFNSQYAGQADGKTVSEVVREEISAK